MEIVLTLAPHQVAPVVIVSTLFFFTLGWLIFGVSRG